MRLQGSLVPVHGDFDDRPELVGVGVERLDPVVDGGAAGGERRVGRAFSGDNLQEEDTIAVYISLC